MCLALNKWMIRNGLSQYGFAKRYRLSQSFLCQLLGGKRKASKATCDLIVQITKGEVRAEDLRPDWFEPPSSIST